MSAVSGRRPKAHKKTSITSVILSYSSRLLYVTLTFFQCVFLIMLYVFYLTQQVLGICTFVYVNYKMGFLFKIGIFTLFYTAKW